MHRKIRYSLANIPGCFDADGQAIHAITIRTTDGKDETYAAKQADARGTTGNEELVRVSIVNYELGNEAESRVVDIKQPFIGFDGWSSKARNFVVVAWHRLGNPSEKEASSFFESATEVE